MEITIIKRCLIIIVIIVSFIVGVIVGTNKRVNTNIQTTIPDTNYNKVILDSIQYNIIKKDTIIYNLKQSMKYEVDKSFELVDSDAVKLFYKLCANN